MNRWLPAVLTLSGCLDAPPAAIDDPGNSSLVLTGVVGRGDLNLDGRDDLVITGVRRDDSGEQPVALVLFASESGIESAVAGGAMVDLPFAPSDIAMTRREDLTGLAVLLGPDGRLVVLDQDLEMDDLTPTDAAVPIDRPFGHVATLETAPGQRLLLAHAGDLWATEQLQLARPLADTQTYLVASGAAIDWLDGVDVGGAHVVNALTAAGDMQTRVFMSGDPPTLEPNLATDTAPAALGSVLWRGTSHDFVYLVGVDLDTPRIFWHRTPVGAGEITSGFVLEEGYDLIDDLTFAVVGGGSPDLVVLGERGGAPVVDMYGDPMENDAFDIGTPAAWLVPGFSAPPIWLEAMDAVGDDSGDLEIIAYDQAGHIACADRGDPGMLTSCGSADLSDLLSGSSTSDRPDW